MSTLRECLVLFVLAATAGLSSASGLDLFVYRTWVTVVDSTGRECWRKEFEFPFSASCSNAIRTGDGGYAFFGTIHPLPDSVGSPDAVFNDGSKPFLIKTDKDLNVLWTQDYSTESVRFSHGTGFAQTDDGGFLLTGLHIAGRGLDPRWLRRVNTDGQEVSYRTVDDEMTTATLVRAAPDRLLMIGSYHSAKEREVYRQTKEWHSAAVIARLNDDGKTLWKREYRGELDNNFLGICAARDGGYVAVGYADAAGQSGHPAWIVKVDSVGNMLWERKWREGKYCTFSSVGPTEHGFAVYGGCDSTQVVAVIDEEGEGFRVTDASDDRAQEIVWANGQKDLVPATWTRANDSTYVVSVHVDVSTTLPFQLSRERWSFLTRLFALPSGEYMATGYKQWQVESKVEGRPEFLR